MLSDSDDNEYKTPENKLEELARRFREGIANAIGVPPEAIREDKVRRWVENWVRAFVKPEYLPDAIRPSSHLLGTSLGSEIANIVRDAIRNKVEKMPKAVRNYVKKMSDFTGLPEEVVAESKPVKNYMKAFQE